MRPSSVVLTSVRSWARATQILHCTPSSTPPQSAPSSNSATTPSASSPPNSGVLVDDEDAFDATKKKAAPVVHRTLPKGTMTRKEWEERQQKFKEQQKQSTGTTTSDAASATATATPTTPTTDPLTNFQQARKEKDAERTQQAKETARLWEDRRRAARQELLKELEHNEGDPKDRGMYEDVTITDILTKRKDEWKQSGNNKSAEKNANDTGAASVDPSAKTSEADGEAAAASEATESVNIKASQRLSDHNRRMRQQPLYRAFFRGLVKFDNWLAGSEVGRLFRSYIVWIADGGGSDRVTLAGLQEGGRTAADEAHRLDRIAGGTLFALLFFILLPMALEPFSPGSLSFLWVVPVKKLEVDEEGKERLVTSRALGGESFETFQLRKRYETMCKTRLSKEALLATVTRMSRDDSSVAPAETTFAPTTTSNNNNNKSSTTPNSWLYPDAADTTDYDPTTTSTASSSLQSDNGLSHLLALCGGDTTKAIGHLTEEIATMKAEELRLRKLVNVDWHIPVISGLIDTVRVYVTRGPHMGTLDRYVDSNFDASQANAAAAKEALSRVGKNNVVHGAFAREAARP